MEATQGSTGSIAARTLCRMVMGTRDPEQPPLWIAASDLPVSPGHPLYPRLNALREADGFDACGDNACRSVYAPRTLQHLLAADKRWAGRRRGRRCVCADGRRLEAVSPPAGPGEPPS